MPSSRNGVEGASEVRSLRFDPSSPTLMVYPGWDHETLRTSLFSPVKWEQLSLRHQSPGFDARARWEVPSSEKTLYRQEQSLKRERFPVASCTNSKLKVVETYGGRVWEREIRREGGKEREQSIQKNPKREISSKRNILHRNKTTSNGTRNNNSHFLNSYEMPDPVRSLWRRIPSLLLGWAFSWLQGKTSGFPEKCCIFNLSMNALCHSMLRSTLLVGLQ